MMIFVILGALFLMVLLFLPIYYFWIREKANDEEKKVGNIEQDDNGKSDS